MDGGFGGFAGDGDLDGAGGGRGERVHQAAAGTQFYGDGKRQTRKKTDAPFYTFNITMQNHGGYTNEQGKVDNGTH